MRIRSWWINIQVPLPVNGAILRYVLHSRRRSPVGLCLVIFSSAHLLVFLSFISHLSISHIIYETTFQIYFLNPNSCLKICSKYQSYLIVLLLSYSLNLVERISLICNRNILFILLQKIILSTNSKGA